MAGGVSVRTYKVGLGPVAVTVADVNGDRRPELIVADAAGLDGPGGDIDILSSAPHRGYRRMARIAGGDATSVVVLRDPGTGDVTLGAAIFSGGSGRLVALSRSGRVTRIRRFPIGYYDHAAATADFDGNGVPDIAVASALGDNSDKAGYVRVLLRRRGGAYSSTRIDMGFRTYAVATPDLNSDGHPDLVALSQAGPVVPGPAVVVRLGLGDGTFGPARDYQAFAGKPATLAAMAVGDLNRHGKPDLVLAAPERNALAILPGLGGGAFGPPEMVAAGHDPRAVTIGDLNGDRIPDMAIADDRGDSVDLLLARAGGGWTRDRIPLGASPSGIALLRLAGHTRVVVTRESADKVSVITPDL